MRPTFNFGALSEALANWAGSGAINEALAREAVLILGHVAGEETGMTYYQAAKCLLAAISNGEAIPALTRVTVNNTTLARSAFLNLDEARQHAVTRDWISADAADAVAAFLREGAIMSEVLGERTSSAIRFCESRGQHQLTIHFATGPLIVIACYGEEIDDAGLMTVRMMPIPTIHEIGFQARSATTQARPIEMPADSGSRQAIH